MKAAAQMARPQLLLLPARQTRWPRGWQSRPFVFAAGCSEMARRLLPSAAANTLAARLNRQSRPCVRVELKTGAHTLRQQQACVCAACFGHASCLGRLCLAACAHTHTSPNKCAFKQTQAVFLYLVLLRRQKTRQTKVCAAAAAAHRRRRSKASYLRHTEGSVTQIITVQAPPVAECGGKCGGRERIFGEAVYRSAPGQ